MTGLTETLARFVANPAFGRLPDEVVRIVKTGFIDTAAMVIVGRDEPAARIVRQFVRRASRQRARRASCSAPTWRPAPMPP